MSISYRFTATWGTVMVLAVLLAQAAFGGNLKVATDLIVRDPNTTVDAIVQFKQPSTERHHPNR